MKQQANSDLVVIDNLEQCPYLPGQVARMPLRVVLQQLTPALTDAYFAAGYRRSGEFVYRAQCPSCTACEPIRISPGEFQIVRGFRRTLVRGKKRYEERIQPLVASQERVEMFNRHRQIRGLSGGENPIDLEDYGWGFVRSCFDSFEIGWYLGGRLVCLSVVDRGEKSMSAVYTFYDPELRGDSLGTFAILRQLELSKDWGLDWLYLGYYVERCEHMNYKSRFLPHERLAGNVWKKFEADASDNQHD